MQNQNNKLRWLISTLVTFTAAFLLVVYTNIDGITVESFRDGTLVSLLFVAARSGVKALIEAFLKKFSNK